MPPTDQPSTRRMSPLIWLALILAALVALMVPYNNPNSNERWETLLGWLFSILLFCAGVLRTSGWRPPAWKEVVAGLRKHWIEIAGVATLMLAALLARTVDLEFLPYAFANDEGWVGIEARNLLAGNTMNFFRVGWSAQPLLSFLPVTLTISLFGSTIFAVRLVSAIEGTLTVLFLYLGGREAFGIRPAILAAGVLAALPVHIHFSRTGFNNITPALFAALLFWLVFRALRMGTASSYLWAGLAAGVAIYSYIGSRLAIIWAFSIFGYMCIMQRQYLSAHWRHLLVIGGAFLIVAGPQLSFFSKSPDLFMARWNGDGILQNGWLARQSAPGGPGLISALGNQLAKSTQVYISSGAPQGFYNSPRPYLPAAGAVFLILGMAASVFLWRKPAYILVLVWFWVVILLGGMLTTSPPASQRLVMGFPAAAMLVGIGLDQSARLLAGLKRIPAAVWPAMAGLIVLAIGIDGLIFYFGEYRQKNYYGDASNEVTVESTRLMKQIDTSYQFALLGAPRVFLDFANFNFFIPNYRKVEIKPENSGPALPSPLPPTMFVAIPERRSDLEAIAREYPGGKWLVVSRLSMPNQTLLMAYIYPPPTTPLQVLEMRQ